MKVKAVLKVDRMKRLVSQLRSQQSVLKMLMQTIHM